MGGDPVIAAAIPLDARCATLFRGDVGSEGEEVMLWRREAVGAAVLCGLLRSPVRLAQPLALFVGERTLGALTPPHTPPPPPHTHREGGRERDV